MDTEGIARVAFEPESVYADPHVVANGFVSKARQAGAEVLTHTPALGISRSNRRVSKVATPKGGIETDTVIIAAGPWANAVRRWVGLDLPLALSREPHPLVRPPAGAPPFRRTTSHTPATPSPPPETAPAPP